MSHDTPPELLPCPFCGTAPVEDRIEPHKHYIAQMPDYPGSWSIECVKCEFRIFDHEARENAVRKWNTRQTRAESGQGTPEGRGSSLAGALADGSPLGSTPEAKAGSAVPAGAAGTPRWREKDPDSGDDLIELWKKRPRHSDEYAAAEIIEQLERELADALKEIAKSEEKQLKAMEFGAQSVRSASGHICPHATYGQAHCRFFFEAEERGDVRCAHE